MTIKRHALALSMLAAMSASSIAHAEEDPAYKAWAGGFFELYNPDSDKPSNLGTLETGEGFGAEFGYRFSPRWATRLEWSYMDLDIDGSGAEDNAYRLGVDAMYFVKDDLFYLFAGVKNLDINRAERVANFGLGKHWKLSENWRVITEAAMYHDFGESHRDWGMKVGLSYVFGGKPSAPPAPKDSDRDGVYDDRDECPNTPPGTQVDSRGCNVDNDGDGVLNDQDQCPNTPPGTEVGKFGCALTLDSDQDGVLDQQDQCPNTPMTDKVDATGCSIFLEQEVSINLSVLFANNSAEVNNPGDDQFQAFADFMARFPNTSAVIEGHTSAVGDAAYNQGLSERRAASVRQLLIDQYSIDAGRLTAQGYGETRLLDDANTAEAHRINRRIEARVTATEKVKAKR